MAPPPLDFNGFYSLLGGIPLNHLCLLRFAGLLQIEELKTCTELLISTKVCRDYCKLRDLKHVQNRLCLLRFGGTYSELRDLKRLPLESWEWVGSELEESWESAGREEEGG